MVSAVSLLPLSAALLSFMLALSAFIVPAHRSRSTVFFALMNISMVLWCGGYFVHLNLDPAVDPALAAPGSLAYVVTAVIAIGIAGSPTYWFLFGASQSGLTRWTEGAGLALAHVPMAYTVVVALTNPWHHLFVRASEAGTAYGPLAPVHHLTAFLLGIAGIVLVIRSLAGSPAGRRLDAAVLGVAVAFPFMGGVLWSTREVTHFALPVQLAPLLQPLANVVLGALVFRSGLGDIIPVGMLRAIMENTDALLVYVDRQLNVVSANSAFLDRVGWTEQQAVGSGLDTVLGDPKLISVVRRACELGERIERRGWPNVLADDEGSSFWNLGVRPVLERGRLIGCVLSVSEVTAEVRDASLNATLSRLTGRLHSTFDAEATLPSVLSTAGSELGADASLVLWRGTGWRWLRWHGPDCSWEPFEPDAAPALAKVIETGQAVGVPDATRVPRQGLSESSALGVGSTLALPLTARGVLLGAVAFTTRDIGEFEARQTAFARELARALAVAVDNTRLYESERDIAGTLQRAMLSIPEQIEGLETAHAYRSATASALVGGDFYDLFYARDGRVAMLIGDVAGKGIGVAAITSVVRDTIRSEALRSSSPATILARANEVVRRRLKPGAFVTAFLGLLDLEGSVLRYSAAGHPAPFLLHLDGCVDRLEGASVVLGAFEDARYDCAERKVEHGDLLLLFTDGLTEIRRQSACEEERLGKLLATLRGKSPAEVVDRVLQHADSDPGGMKDDVAVLAVRLH